MSTPPEPRSIGCRPVTGRWNARLIGEAVSHLSNGLEALLRLPASAERDVCEVELQGGLFRSRTVTDGRASANAASSLDRMRELSTRRGDPDTLLTVLIGDRIQHGSGAKYREALRVSAETALSTSRQEPHVGTYKRGSVVGGCQRAAMRGCLGFWPMQASSCSTRYRLHGLLICTWNMNNGRRHVSLLSRHKHLFGVTTNTSGCPKFTDWKVVFGGPKVSTIARARHDRVAAAGRGRNSRAAGMLSLRLVTCPITVIGAI